MSGWWLGRVAMAFLRRAGAGRGLPVRRADRVEGAAVLLVLILALVTLPLAMRVGEAVNEYNIGVSAAEKASHRQVTATLTGAAETTLGHDGATTSNPAPATWLGPDGVRHNAQVAAPISAKAGSTTPIWIDEHGDKVDPPLTTDQAFWRGVLAGTGMLLATGFLLWAGLRLVRSRCDRQRYAAWERGWRSTEPLWSNRR